MTVSTDQTNGEQEKLAPKTFVFFSSKTNLGIRQLRKDFLFKNGRLIKVTKDYLEVKAEIEAFYAVLSNQLGDLNGNDSRVKFYSFSPHKRLTHILVMPYQTCTKILGLLKYADEVIGGIDVTTDQWDVLSKLLDQYAACAEAIMMKENCISALRYQFENLAFNNVTEEPFSEDTMASISNTFGSYLNPLILGRLAEIQHWYAVHRWRDISEVNEATS